MIFSSVDLPEPFRPSTPILAPGKKRERDVLEDLPLRRHDLADAVHREDVLGHANVLDGGVRLKRKGEGAARGPRWPIRLLSPGRAGPGGSGRKARQLERLAVVLAVGRIAVVQARQVLADAEGRRQRQGQAALLGRRGGVAALRRGTPPARRGASRRAS